MEITPLPQGFGAVVTGIDADAVSPPDIVALQDAYNAHHLLIFRDLGELSGARQAAMAGWFGAIGANRTADGNPWTTLDNVDEVGSAVLPFHCDISYMEHPFDGLSLHPVALPEGGSSTTFISNAVGWDNLNPELQDLMRHRKVRHVFHDHAMVAGDWPKLAWWHPACLPHPATGRPMLFVSQNHVREIEGFDAVESAPLLDRIFAVQYAPARQYEHHWRKGDLLVWCNVAIQHARTQAAQIGAGRRIMQRVALGEHGFMDQVARLREAAL